MTLETDVAAHYTTAELLDRIRAALARAGADPENLTPADLKPVDEFHIGGAAATEALVSRVAVGPDARVLDIGCGIGGTARLVAGQSGARVTGVDLTPDFVATAEALSRAVGMGDRTEFRTGSALSLPFDDGSFDLALLLHVGMNIADKAKLMAEAARVLTPGGHFLVYEVMRTGENEPAYPVPWAATPATSFLGAPEDYRRVARDAGFELVDERDRRDFALDFFARMQARMADGGPPPLGIHLLMGETAPQKIANMVTNIRAGAIAPVEMVLRKRV